MPRIRSPKQLFLSSAYRQSKMIRAKQIELANLRELATAVPIGDPSKLASRTNAHRDRIASIIADIADREATIAADIQSLIARMNAISSAIAAVDNEDYKLLLQMRYLSFLPWREIADQLEGYHERSIFKIHERALKEINIKQEIGQ